MNYLILIPDISEASWFESNNNLVKLAIGTSTPIYIHWSTYLT